MPIDNIRYRAEIGNFYNALHRFSPITNLRKRLDVQMCLSSLQVDKYGFPSVCHVFSLLTTIFLFPLIFVCVISVSDFTNVTSLFRCSFRSVYFLFRFFYSLIECVKVFRRNLAMFFTQYFFFFQVFIFFPFIRSAILLCGDVEKNPGPQLQDLSLCHWNLNGICANNFVKVSLLEAYNAVHNFDIICISETFLDSDHSRDDPRFQLDGYLMERSDHPSDSKRGGVCIYYKEHLPFVKRDDLSLLNECFVGEIKTKGSKCFITCLYRSPSQSPDELSDFLSDFEQICSNIALETPACSIFLGDFNAKCTNWWPDNENNPCGLELFTLSTSFGYTQLIDEPTHFAANKSPSCIDLIFVSQPNLVVESGVHPSLCRQCRHQITFAKLSFKVALPPSYEREIWHYDRARVDLIQRSIKNFDWLKAFRNKCINDQVETFNSVLLNIFRNFIPNEIIKCSYKDPPWISSEIKKVVRKKNRLYKKYVANGKCDEDETRLKQLTDHISELIANTKSKYFSNLSDKLNDPLTSPKTYWSIMKRLMNKIKVPNIPPLLVDGTIETDFEKKAGIFNIFFAKQCNIIENDSTLPNFIFKTDKRLRNVIFSSSDISKIIEGLNPNKAHGHESISVKMIKLCGDSIIHPLKLLYESSISCGQFPDLWKKGNIVPVHKKESKNLVKNYRPISLLPIFGKVFEKVLYDKLYKYFQDNKLLNANQSGFRKGDSCVSQLLAITQEIYRSFDGNISLDTRGVFLDISKAFDKVWHEGLLFKLNSYGVEGDFYNILRNYLQNRKQRVVLCGQHSTWLDVNAGVPQGSVLGPLLFLIYINDLPENLISLPKLFADDTSIFSTVRDIHESGFNLNSDLASIRQWAYLWKMSFNPDPNKQATEVIFSHKTNPANHPQLLFNDSPVATLTMHKHLGLILDEKLTFVHHVNEKISKAYKGISLIKRLYNVLPRKSLLCIYRSFVRPHLDYADVIYDRPHNDSFCDKIETVQYNAALAITGVIRGTSRERLYQELGLESLRNRRWYRRLLMFYKILSGESPEYLRSLLPPEQLSYNPQKQGLIRNFRANTVYFQNSFFPYTINAWNNLGEDLRNSPSISCFKKSILAFIRPRENSIYNICDTYGLKLLTRLRVNFSHLREHKFRHNFRDTLNPLCSCGLEVESTIHYLLRCPFFSSERKSFLDEVSAIIGGISHLPDQKLVNILLYGKDYLTIKQNSSLLSLTIAYLKLTGRFDIPLL